MTCKFVHSAEKVSVLRDVDNDIEDRYCNMSQENLVLKRTINQQLKLIKKLNASLQWYSRKESKEDKRSPSRDPGDEIRMRELETANQILTDKVKVMKQQLLSLSTFHASIRQPNMCGVPSSKEMLTSSPPKRSKSTAATVQSLTQVDSMSNIGTDEKMNVQPLFTIDEDLEGLREDNQLGIFEADCGMRSDAENACNPNDIANKLLVNVEVIRMKRIMKWQNAQLTTLLSCVDNLNKESQSMKDVMGTITQENDDLKKSLSFEKKKYKMLEKDSVSKDYVKVLEEQVRDLQNERSTLRDHNKKLLNLAAEHEFQTNKIKLEKQVVKQTRDCASQTSFEFPLDRDGFGNLSKDLKSSQQKNTKKHKLSSASTGDLSTCSKQSKQDILSDMSEGQDYSQEYSTSTSVNLDSDDVQSGDYHGEQIGLNHTDSGHLANNFEKQLKKKQTRIQKSKEISKHDKSKQITSKGKESFCTCDDSGKKVTSCPQCALKGSRTEHSSQKNNSFRLNVSKPALENDQILKAELAESQCELERCRQMLRIQCSLNSIYKEELEKLTSELKKAEVQNDGSVKAVEVLLREHLEQMERIQSSKQFQSHEQQTDEPKRGTIASFQTPNKSSKLEKSKNLGVDSFTDLENLNVKNKVELADDNPEEKKEIEELPKVAAEPANLISVSGEENGCQFELNIHKLIISSHSFTPKTQLFLTWGFLDQDEYAYSPIRPVNDLDFSCSCIYKGNCCQELIDFLVLHGVVIEIYQVVGKECIKISEAAIDTSLAVKLVSTVHASQTPLDGQIISGVLHSSFCFTCSDKIINQFFSQKPVQQT